MFIDSFHKMGRADQFSYQGLCALFDYYKQYEEDIGYEIELDVIALCCEFAEFDSLDDFRDQYGEQYDSIDDVAEQTTVIDIDGERFIAGEF
jgi:hypothetical protein